MPSWGAHIAKTGNTAKVTWNMLDKKESRKRANNRALREQCSDIVRTPKTAILGRR
jgi:hypothetical protein